MPPCLPLDQSLLLEPSNDHGNEKIIYMSPLQNHRWNPESQSCIQGSGEHQGYSMYMEFYQNKQTLQANQYSKCIRLPLHIPSRREYHWQQRGPILQHSRSPNRAECSSADHN